MACYSQNGVSPLRIMTATFGVDRGVSRRHTFYIIYITPINRRLVAAITTEKQKEPKATRLRFMGVI
mgnify:FL=1